MATWKKIIVSGSDAHLSSVTASNSLAVGTNQVIGTTQDNTSLSGSFTGSFFGDGSGLSGVSASFPLTQKTPIIGTDQVFINDGTSKYATVSQFTSASHAGISGDITIDGSGVATFTATVVSASSLSSAAQGSVTLTTNGVAAAAVDLGLEAGDSPQFVGLTLTGDLAVNGGDITTTSTTFNVATTNATTINLGTTNGSTINIGASTSTVTVNDNLVVTGDLTVNGDVTTINTTNLLVEDQFALFASGSDGSTDGGIIVQQGASTGYALGVDASGDRWALQNNASPTATAITPDAFMGVIQEGTNDPASNPVYGGAAGYGTVFVNSNNGEIWIFS